MAAACNEIFKASLPPTNIPIYCSVKAMLSQCQSYHIADQYRGILVGGSDALTLSENDFT
jgi:hypothetical protein